MVHEHINSKKCQLCTWSFIIILGCLLGVKMKMTTSTGEKLLMASGPGPRKVQPSYSGLGSQGSPQTQCVDIYPFYRNISLPIPGAQRWWWI